MRTTSLLIAIGLLVCGSAQAISVTIMRAGATNKKKIHVQFETRLEPSGDPSQVLKLGGGVVVADAVFHRYLQDDGNKVYYGYDISVEPTGEDSTLRVTILPLSIGPERLHLPNPEKWTALSPPRFPKAQTARLGDTMAFDLFVNPSTGQKVVEYVFFGDSHRMKTAIGPARPFTIHDAEIEIWAPKFTVNGELLEAFSKTDAFIQGHFVSFYLPDRGRFVLSLVPHPEVGLLKAGEVRGSTLRFDVDGDTYEVNCKDKIAPGLAAYDLYLFHDATYRRDPHPDSISFGSSDAFQGVR